MCKMAYSPDTLLWPPTNANCSACPWKEHEPWKKRPRVEILTPWLQPGSKTLRAGPICEGTGYKAVVTNNEQRLQSACPRTWHLNGAQESSFHSRSTALGPLVWLKKCDPLSSQNCSIYGIYAIHPDFCWTELPELSPPFSLSALVVSSPSSFLCSGL